MEPAPLTDRIVNAFPSMPPQLQNAARYILDRPGEVALLSMREQARQAGVQPATMTRLAKRLGLDGYEAVRQLYAQAIREGGLRFAGKAGAQVASQKARGERALAAEMVASLAEHIASLSSSDTLDRLTEAAERLDQADKLYCLGLRSAHAVAWHMNYVVSLLSEKAVLLDGVAGTGMDAIRMATGRDALFVVSVEPYTRMTIDAAAYAHSRGIPIVAVTDSPLSPLAALARTAIFVPTEGPSFFHTMTPAFVVGEILAALVAGRGGGKSLEALKRTEEQLTAFNIHWSPQSDRRT